MNGYDLAAKMRKARRKHHLNATDQALFYELSAICNEEGWPKTFNCSNAELCSAIRITENTLVKSRSHLIDAELISFQSGKSKRSYSSYSFTTSKFEVKGEVNNEVNNEVESAVKTADYNKGKQKSKTKTKKESVEKKAIRFSAPFQTEVYSYMKKKGLSDDLAKLESEKFWHFYNSKDWYIGKSKIKSWTSAAANWINRMNEFNFNLKSKSGPTINRQSPEVIHQNSNGWIIDL